MSWLTVSLITDAAHAEGLADALTERGALSAAIDDADAGTEREAPMFDEPGETRPLDTLGWARSKVSALFSPQPTARLEEIVAAAATAAGIAGALPFTVETLEEEDWVRVTQAQFEPIRISARLWIVPSWHHAPDPAALCIELDPGLAFGTGSHATTRLCLQWLEQAVTPGASLLDYGCGSGILAIAAGKLGAGKLLGIDIDPQAVEAARHNATKNGVSALFALTDQTTHETTFDLVVANILANPLRALAPALCCRVRPGGQLALSGILAAQAAEIVALYAPWVGLKVFGEDDGWVCLAGHRQGALT